MTQDIDVEPGEVRDLVPVEESSFDLATASPVRAMEHAQEVVQFMSSKCTGSQYIAIIQGRKYPKVEWWTTVGMSLGLFPAEVVSERFEMDKNHYGYRSVVEVLHKGQVVTRASAICTTEESAWGKRDEYAVKSMATTRATGKAYRIGLSGLAVLAGLEPTPADEIPPGGFGNRQDRRPSQQRTAPADPPVRAHTSTLSEAAQRGMAAVRALFPDGEAAQIREWLADACPEVAAKPATERTDADWEAVAEHADATLASLHPEYEDAEGEK
jgi:hypothetical protein